MSFFFFTSFFLFLLILFYFIFFYFTTEHWDSELKQSEWYCLFICAFFTSVGQFYKSFQRINIANPLYYMFAFYFISICSYSPYLFMFLFTRVNFFCTFFNFWKWMHSWLISNYSLFLICSFKAIISLSFSKNILKFLFWFLIWSICRLVSSFSSEKFSAILSSNIASYSCSFSYILSLMKYTLDLPTAPFNISYHYFYIFHLSLLKSSYFLLTYLELTNSLFWCG